MSKQTLFDRTYTGPRGPHLGSMTTFTRTGKLAKVNTSIHGRLVRLA